MGGDDGKTNLDLSQPSYIGGHWNLPESDNFTRDNF